MRKRYLIFDAYGTLFSTGTASVDATRAILDKNGRADIDAHVFYAEWKTLRAQMIASMTVFVPEAEVFRETLRHLYQTYGIDGDFDADVQIMLDTWGTRDAFADVKPALARLAKQYTICVGSTTDTEPLLADLKRNGLTVECVYTSQMLSVYKPHAAFYRRILDDLHADASEVLFVGDSLTDDVWGPARLGIKTCHVNRKQTTYRDIVPDLSVASLQALADRLTKT